MKSIWVVGLVAVAVGLASLGVIFFDYLPVPRPREYMNVTLGDTRDEVRYKLGIPQSVLGPVIEDGEEKGFQPVYDTDKKEGPTAIPSGKKYDDFDEWMYGDNVKYVVIDFSKEGRARRVTCFDSSKSSFCQPLAGVQIGDLEADIVKRLGPPSSSRISGVSKTITYEKRNLGVTLEKQKAYLLELAGPVETDPRP